MKQELELNLGCYEDARFFLARTRSKSVCARRIGSNISQHRNEAMTATYNYDEMKPNFTIHMCAKRMREKVAPTRISEK